jgi:uncharacterized protein YqiB (DUF1249 family)
MPTRIQLRQNLPPCSGACEAVDWVIGQAALRATVLRKVISALHRHHCKSEAISWANCSHQHCKLVHDCLEGEVAHGQLEAAFPAHEILPFKKEA